MFSNYHIYFYYNLHLPKVVLIFVLSFFFAVNVQSQVTPFEFIHELPEYLEESSALISTEEGIFTLNDDNEPEVFRINPKTGEIIQTISIADISFDDKEALTSDDTFLYIGDFGNNNGDRRDLKIVRIAFSDFSDSETQTVKGEIISFDYPEQKSFKMKKKENAFDAEAMIAYAGKLYVFTKQRNDHQTSLYEIPAEPGSYAAKKISTFDVNGRITDAALSPDNKNLLLLGYQDDHLHSFLWKFEGFGSKNFFSGKATYKTIVSESIDWQTEGLTFINTNDILLSCETTKDIQASLYYGNINSLFN